MNEDRAIQLADDALTQRRVRNLADQTFLRLGPAERRVLRLRFKNDPEKLARFDALEAQEASDA